MAFREELLRRLEKKHSEISTLAGKLKEAEVYAQALEDMLKLLPGDDAVSTENSGDTALREGSSIARAKEALQIAGRPMQINELLSAMGKQPDKDTRAALAGSIGAYVRRGEIFTRPAPNTFGLIGMKPSNAMKITREDTETDGPHEQGPDPPFRPDLDDDVPF